MERHFNMGYGDQYVELKKAQQSGRLEEQSQFLNAMQAFGQFMNQRQELQQNAPYRDAMAQQALADAQYKQAQLKAYNSMMNSGMGQPSYGQPYGMGQPQGGLVKSYKNPFTGQTIVPQEWLDYESSKQDKKAQSLINKEVQVAQAKKANDAVSNILPAIDQFQSLKKSYQVGFNPISVNLEKKDLLGAGLAKVKGALTVAAANVGLNPEARTYLQNLDVFATSLSRGVFQEKGTLTDKDRSVITKMFNLALANKEEASTAFTKIEEIMQKGLIRNYVVKNKITGDSIIDQPGISDSFKQYYLDAKKLGFEDDEIFKEFLKDE